VFDLDAGPVTVTLPDADQRFMSLQPNIRRRPSTAQATT
jgi:hypothetical protein